MFQQFNISRTGFGVYQKMMFNITNNLANANTPAFKQSRTEVATLFPVVLQEAEMLYAEDQVNNPYRKKKRGVELGSGVQIEAITQDFSQGTIKTTRNQFDVAIQGKGFLQFRSADGQALYSRAGNLRRNSQGDLMSQSGHLLDPPVQLPTQTEAVTIDQEGRVFAQVSGDPVSQEVGQLLLANFSNPDSLKQVGHNMYEETEQSGEPYVNVPGQNGAGEMVQYAIENSNVDVIKEMMEMIMTQKGLELLGKAMNAGQAMLRAGMGMGDK
ncbi:flagellar basal body rod protein FlgG [Candidatus Marinamargulisbacteria bacterium SCGC AG-439-L15]|nr:flagellar basal body rod protein FlgG [Candidatus Marinamargulisbacteria bacterium SCGC AG-439-L15]